MKVIQEKVKLKKKNKLKKAKEIGGPKGPEPTRYGDWERKGICYDF